MVEPIFGLVVALVLGGYLLVTLHPSRKILSRDKRANGGSMSIAGWLQIIVVLALVVAAAVPLGGYIGCASSPGEQNFLSPVLAPVERGFYRLAGVDARKEQGWLAYTMAMLIFSLFHLLVLYAMQRFQNLLPLDPQGFDPVAPDLAFNTSMSFVTNTNWQNYAGETTLTHFVQMLGLTVHNFLSPAVGLAMAVALARAFIRSEAKTIGNFWVDMTRSALYVMLPLAILVALALVVLGVPQTLLGSVDATTLEGVKQTISLGPIATQEAIKELGTNGGGFLNANSAHPFENPNAWSNLIENWACSSSRWRPCSPSARMLGDARQGRSLLWAMAIVTIVGVIAVYWAESYGNPILTALGLDPAGRQHGRQGGALRPGDDRPLGSDDDGHEHRRGQRHARFADGDRRPRADVQHAARLHHAGRRGLRPLRHRRRGLAFGLRRRPDGRPHAGISRQEDRGARDEVRDVRAAHLHRERSRLRGGLGRAPFVQDDLGNKGPHGLSEIIYAFASTNGNNGSAFAGLNGNNLWFNTTLGLAMFLGRFGYVVPVLALAGSLASKKKVAPSAGTFPTTGPLFVGLLLGVIVILYLLQYFPALALGPVVEHFLMLAGKSF